MLTWLLIGWKMKVCLALWLGAALVLCCRRSSASRLRKSWIAMGGISFLLLTVTLGNRLVHRYLIYVHERQLVYDHEFPDPDLPDAAVRVRRHLAINARAQQGNVDLIFIGDSITQGWETNGVEQWRKLYQPRNAMNAGCFGDSTQHVLWRLDHGNIDNLTPRLAVLMIGTCNIGQPSEEISRGIGAIVQRLRVKLPTTKILLLGVFPLGQQPDDPLRIKINAVNATIRNLDDGMMVHYLNINEKFLTSDGRQDREIHPDGVHLSPKGYEIWANAIEPTVADLLDENNVE